MIKQHNWFTEEQILSLALRSDGDEFAVHSMEQAYQFCSSMAKRHYENFPVASVLLPGKLRPPIAAIYAFSRIADDIADEMGSLGPFRQEQCLQQMEQLLLECSEQQFRGNNPLWMAIQDMMLRYGIEMVQPLLRLLKAFKSDINFAPPQTINELMNYCHNSADPIGELLLRLYGLWNKDTAPLSDAICSALQITNFVQDISRDIPRGRLYIPAELMPHSTLQEFHLVDDFFSAKFQCALKEIFSYVSGLFDYGSGLLRFLPSMRLRAEISLTIQGGRAILSASERLGIALMHNRPYLKKRDLLYITCSAFLRHPVLFSNQVR